MLRRVVVEVFKLVGTAAALIETAGSTDTHKRETVCCDVKSISYPSPFTRASLPAVKEILATEEVLLIGNAAEYAQVRIWPFIPHCQSFPSARVKLIALGRRALSV